MKPFQPISSSSPSFLPTYPQVLFPKTETLNSLPGPMLWKQCCLPFGNSKVLFYYAFVYFLNPIYKQFKNHILGSNKNIFKGFEDY